MDTNIHNQLRVHASPSHLVKFQKHEMKFNLDDCQIKKLYDSVKSFYSVQSSQNNFESPIKMKVFAP